MDVVAIDTGNFITVVGAILPQWHAAFLVACKAGLIHVRCGGIPVKADFWFMRATAELAI
jgi:hypothetical protein